MGAKATNPKGRDGAKEQGGPALTRAYVRRILVQEFKKRGIPADVIDEEMISEKREIITARRLLRQLDKLPKASRKEA